MEFLPGRGCVNGIFRGGGNAIRKIMLTSAGPLNKIARGGIMLGPTSSNAVTAAVVRNKGGTFTIEKLSMGEPRDDEVLVRIVATGKCHTDMILRHQMYPVPQPIVLGHEGAGIVEKVGPDVTKVKPGDHGVL